jgi:hypothetical protein
MPDKTEQREAGGRHGALGEPGGGDAVALERERRPLVVQRGGEHLTLGRDPGRAAAFHGHRCSPAVE